jgi:hypothetical protein
MPAGAVGMPAGAVGMPAGAAGMPTGATGMPANAGMPAVPIGAEGYSSGPPQPPPGGWPAGTIIVPDSGQGQTGGRYKKYSKKGGNSIFTPGGNFSSLPAEIATQMDSRVQAQHIPKGVFGMKELSGVDAQMAASRSVINMMSGGRKKSSKKLKGGVSDYATTLSSRGPINYPDNLSAQRFRYFNKTGTYIPNSMLQYAAAPISTGYECDQNSYPMAYNDYIGGTRKKAPANKKTSSDKKKKAASSSKKKTTSSKKKKSTSDKKKK